MYFRLPFIIILLYYIGFSLVTPKVQHQICVLWHQVAAANSRYQTEMPLCTVAVYNFATTIITKGVVHKFVRTKKAYITKAHCPIRQQQINAQFNSDRSTFNPDSNVTLHFNRLFAFISCLCTEICTCIWIYPGSNPGHK